MAAYLVLNTTQAHFQTGRFASFGRAICNEGTESAVNIQPMILTASARLFAPVSLTRYAERLSILPTRPLSAFKR